MLKKIINEKNSYFTKTNKKMTTLIDYAAPHVQPGSRFIRLTRPCNILRFFTAFNGNFQVNFFYIFLIFSLYINCKYVLEPTQRGHDLYFEQK